MHRTRSRSRDVCRAPRTRTRAGTLGLKTISARRDALFNPRLSLVELAQRGEDEAVHVHRIRVVDVADLRFLRRRTGVFQFHHINFAARFNGVDQVASAFLCADRHHATNDAVVGHKLLQLPDTHVLECVFTVSWNYVLWDWDCECLLKFSSGRRMFNKHNAIATNAINICVGLGLGLLERPDVA